MDVVRQSHASFMCILYVVLGAVSLVCNAMNILVILLSIGARRRYLYLAAYNVGEMVNAVSYILVGIGRGQANAQGILFTSMKAYDCFTKKFWTHSLIIGTEVLAYLMILIALERFFAVLKPMAYKSIFQERNKVIFLFFIPTACLVSLSVGWISSYMESDRVVATQHCFIIDSTGKWYATFHFVIVVIAFYISFCSFLVAWNYSRKFSCDNVTHSRHNLSIWIAISASTAFLVSIPSFVMLIMLWSGVKFNDVIVSLAYSVNGLLSIVHTILNLVFHAQFRRQVLRLMHKEMATSYAGMTREPAVALVHRIH